MADRYLRFDNLDMEGAEIHARCSRCGREFSATPKANEMVDITISRMRAEYDSHKCEVPSPTFHDTMWK